MKEKNVLMNGINFLTLKLALNELWKMRVDNSGKIKMTGDTMDNVASERITSIGVE